MDPMTIIAIINATESGLKMLNSLMEENENALKINLEQKRLIQRQIKEMAKLRIKMTEEKLKEMERNQNVG